MNTSTDVLVIGAGQAGLSAAYHLDRLDLDYQVLDAETGPGGAWQHRWPTLTMATVNGIRELPGSTSLLRRGRETLHRSPVTIAEMPARQAIPEYFAAYESEFHLKIRRPVKVRRVE